jgi:divalent metal cation (Fe/Co/Zn/Cd) transporter
MKNPKYLQQGLTLEYITLGWNIIGTLVIVSAALAARSVALAGFGLDSLIEIVASTVVVWELTGQGKGREKPALRLMGWAFIALAVYILVQSAFSLLTHRHATTSLLGSAWLAATFLVMLSLSYGKTRLGNVLNNPVLKTEGKVTLVDAYLAGAVLMGLLLNARLGLWWADPVAALVIVFYGFKEGTHALKESAIVGGLL